MTKIIITWKLKPTFKISLSFCKFIFAVLGLCCCVWAFSSCSKPGKLSTCSAQASHYSGFSCCRARALGAWASLAEALGLSCFTACWIFPQGLNLCPLYWQVDSQALDHQFSSVQSLSRVRLFATPQIAACQASLSITNSQSSLRLIHVHWVSDAIQPSHPLASPSPPAPNPSQHQSLFNESTLCMRWPNSKISQGWPPSEWTGWISLQSKGLSRVFSNTTVQKHQFFGAQPSSQSNSHIHTWPLELTSNSP